MGTEETAKETEGPPTRNRRRAGYGCAAPGVYGVYGVYGE
jgi:hypothetical protein